MVDLLFLDALSEHLLSFLHYGQDPGLSLVRPARQEVTSLKTTAKMGGNVANFFCYKTH
jgi:hypothetical protein